MKSWLFLAVAIIGEVAATSALKSSDGFTKLAPSAVVVVGYGVAIAWSVALGGQVFSRRAGAYA